MRVTTQRATTHSPRPDHHGPPHVAPLPLHLPHLSARARVPAHHESTLTLLLRSTQQPGSARHAVWGGTIMSRPITVTPRTQGSIAHAKAAHTRRVSTKSPRRQRAVSVKGRRDHTAPPPPGERTQASTQTPTRTQPESANTQPHHPQANTPTVSPNKARPQANTRAPTPNVWASKMCERGNPWQQGRPARTKRRRPTRARRQRTQQGAQTMGFAPCAVCARKGGQRERKAAHNSPRQGAWVVVFVGVFADVCRRFWAGWFGGLGVFWGCLACFLVF